MPEPIFDISKCLLAILAGVGGGAVNTLAGNGSAITLPMLVFLGLEPDEANATNRVGVVMGSLVGAGTFKRSGLLESKGIPWLLLPVVLGASAGAIIAAHLDPEKIKVAIASVMVVMLILVITQPKRWIREEGIAETNHKKVSTLLIFFAIGAYGGFIQAGVGILLLAALVLKAKYTLVKANAIKVVVVLTFTIPALAIFLYYDQVRWLWGLSMATGQGFGAWLAARFVATHPRANVWIRRLLVLIIVAALFRLFEMNEFIARMLS